MYRAGADRLFCGFCGDGRLTHVSSWDSPQHHCALSVVVWGQSPSSPQVLWLFYAKGANSVRTDDTLDEPEFRATPTLYTQWMHSTNVHFRVWIMVAQPGLGKAPVSRICIFNFILSVLHLLCVWHLPLLQNTYGVPQRENGPGSMNSHHSSSEKHKLTSQRLATPDRVVTRLTLVEELSARLPCDRAAHFLGVHSTEGVPVSTRRHRCWVFKVVSHVTASNWRQPQACEQQVDASNDMFLHVIHPMTCFFYTA
jgi:hypothetical protein